jgi:hypothetical protein
MQPAEDMLKLPELDKGLLNRHLSLLNRCFSCFLFQMLLFFETFNFQILSNSFKFTSTLSIASHSTIQQRQNAWHLLWQTVWPLHQLKGHRHIKTCLLAFTKVIAFDCCLRIDHSMLLFGLLCHRHQTLSLLQRAISVICCSSMLPVFLQQTSTIDYIR